MPPIDATTEQDFAARMDKLGVTQSFLAQYVGLSQSEVSKIVGGIRPQDSQRTKQIDEALQELEGVAVFFAPMKPAFEDADAVKAWLRSPVLPNLFKLLTDAQLLQLNASELTAVNAVSSENERLEAEIAALQEKTRNEFTAWMENPSGR
jgi:transcriptional regulator with XRE-family HTH domain